jgi:hypothetical protein
MGQFQNNINFLDHYKMPSQLSIRLYNRKSEWSGPPNRLIFWSYHLFIFQFSSQKFQNAAEYSQAVQSVDGWELLYLTENSKLLKMY